MMDKYDPDAFFNRKRPTNGDRIRSSSNEDIAAFVLELLDLLWRGATYKTLPERYRNEYRKLLIDWLQQEASVDVRRAL